MNGAVIREAVISADGRYRYVLNRRWDRSLPVMPWVGLNPSKADGRIDDPTVLRMCWYALREGCGGICLLNLYALRSADPAALRHALEAGLDPAGPDNDTWIAGLASDARGGHPVVVAWGAHPLTAARVPRVLGILAGLPLACLGTTKSGAPRHPCRHRKDAPLVPWRP